MQLDLQPRAHLPQRVHLSVSMTGRMSDTLLSRLSTVPTGHMVLQYSRPQSHAEQVMIMSVRSPVTKSARLTEPAKACTSDCTIRP